MFFRAQKFVLAAAAATAFSGVASATTIGFTEGERPQVVDTEVITPTDASNHAPGWLLGTLSAPPSAPDTFTEIDLYGRIVKAIDYYTVTATTDFTVSFILTGYTEMKNNGKLVDVAGSGFVADNQNKSNESEFKLTVTGPSGATTAMVFTTPITAANATTALILSASAGTYYFTVDGGFDDGPDAGARYDLAFAVAPASAGGATPLPATLPILATGVGLGAGMLGWRRKRVKAAA